MAWVVDTGSPFFGGEQQPQGGGQECRHHDIHKLHRLEVHFVQIDNAFADGVGYFAAGNHRTAHLENSGNQQRLRNGERAGTHAGAERVGYVVTADIEGHKYTEQRGQQKQHGVVVVGVAQAPENKIADHADQQGGKSKVDFLYER